MRFYAIQSGDVGLIWPTVEAMLARACARSVGDLSPATLREACETREAVLLIVADGARVVAAAVASFLRQADGRLACSLDACGGSELRAWRGVIPDFEAWAKHRGASQVRFSARRGWARVFRGYRATPLVCLSKDL